MESRTRKNKRGFMQFYLKWPLMIGIVLVVAWVMVIRTNLQAGLVMLPFVLIILGYAIYLKLSTYNDLMYSMLNFVNDNTTKQEQFLKNVSIPYAVCDEKGILIYVSKHFLNLSNEVNIGKNITSIFSELNKNFLFNVSNDEIEVLSQYKGKIYNIHIMNMDIKEILEFIGKSNDEEINIKKVYFLYLEDESRYYELKKQYDDIKSVVGYISIDNYFEVTENLDDSKATMLVAMVDRKLTRYISNNGGVIKRLEKDKYFFVSTKEHLESMIKDRFSILDDTKEIIGGDNIPLTLSIGVGYEGKSLETNHDYANIAFDMALGRGGDQAVVKKGQDLMFFGGKSASTNSNQRVRARVKATSFKEIIDTKDSVFIVGHKDSDMDAFGASLGVYTCASFLGKKVYIVENSVTRDVQEVKNGFMEKRDFPKDVFIDGDEAVRLFDENSLLVIVDHNNPYISDEPRLLDMSTLTVMFDHHRLSPNSIQNAIMSYVEPSSSSTCEIISEIMQYFDDRIKVGTMIADTMLCGVIVDTNNFTFMTSSKTFDAASFLRTSGADINRVRKMLRVSLESEKIKHDLEDNIEFYKNDYGVVAFEDIENQDNKVLAAKVANDIINIDGIKASVVITHTKENNICNVSARSIDEVNVQVLMEKLGGGGHRGAAGAKLENCLLDDAVLKVKEAIDQMIQEKEIS